MLEPLDVSPGLTVPADVSSNPAQAAASTSKESYDLVLEGMPIRLGKEYVFSFRYAYVNPDTGNLVYGPPSPLFRTGLVIEDKTEEITNLSVKAGYKSYELKWDPVTFSGFIDVQVYESLTSDFATQELKYMGTSNQVNILTSNTTPRYIKVVTRDKWLNSKTVTYGPITPLNPDPDTSTPPSPPSGASASGSVDSNDLSGFGGQMVVSWTANTDSNTSGYVVRWSTDNPATVTYPNWEYGQVEGKTVTTFKITGLLLNTVYYYQITSKSPYNAISWVGSPVQTLSAIVDSTAGGAWSRIKSFLTIGGATGDLFKFGTAIPASLNFSTTTTPSLTSGTYSGTILNISTTNVGNNYWLNTGRFRVGSATSFLYWDGLDLYTTGKINATGGSFTGDVQLNGGSLYAGALPNSGQRVRLNSSGIFAYNSGGTQTFSLDTAGYMNATSGLIGGWTLGSTTLSANNVTLNSAGSISLGSNATQSVYLSSTDAYRIWVGSNSGSNAPFRVSAAGILYTSGATIDGNATITGTVSIGGTAASTVVTNAAKGATALQSIPSNYLTTTTSISGGQITTGTIKNGSFNGTADGINFNTAGMAINLDNSSITSPFFTINSSGAKFKGDISGASGTFTGKMKVGTNNTATFFETSYTRTYNGNSITGTGVNAIAMEDQSTSGVYSHWYPYNNGVSDLGTTSFAWRRGRFTQRVYAGYGGSDTIPTGLTNTQPYTVLLEDGRIFANTLGTNSGTAIVQDANGYLKVSSSSRKYKENIIYKNETYLDAILQLKPVTFNYKKEFSGSEINPPVYGLIAEDVAEIDSLNEIVNYNIEGGPESIAYDRLSVFLATAIQEISVKLDNLSGRLDAIGA